MAGINRYIGQKTENFSGIKYKHNIKPALRSSTKENHNIAGFLKIINLQSKERDTNAKKQGNQKRVKLRGTKLNTP